MNQPLTRSDARLNRQRVIQAAREVLAERGVQAEMKEIADRAGVGMGTVYRNFATKEELIQAIIGEVVARFDAALDEAETMEDPREAMVFLLRMVWEVAEENGELIEPLVRAGYDKGAAPEATRKRGLRLLERGIARGVFRADIPAEFLRDYLDATMPFVYWRLRQSWGREATMAYCEQLLLSTLSGPEGGTR